MAGGEEFSRDRECASRGVSVATANRKFVEMIRKTHGDESAVRFKKQLGASE